MPRSRLARAGVLLLAWVVLTGALIAIGEAVVHSSSITAFDHHVTRVVVDHRTSALDSFMKALTWLGSWVALLVTGTVIVFLAVRRRLPMIAVVLAAVAWLGEALGVTVAKHVVQRQRPPEYLRLITAHGWSWPSGHTAAAVVIFTALAMTVAYVVRSSRWSVLSWVTAIIAVVAVGFSRVELGVHWFTDVIASVLFATGWLIAIFELFDTDLARRPPTKDEAELSDAPERH